LLVAVGVTAVAGGGAAPQLGAVRSRTFLMLVRAYIVRKTFSLSRAIYLQPATRISTAPIESIVRVASSQYSGKLLFAIAVASPLATTR
jgi:hypothetical protein